MSRNETRSQFSVRRWIACAIVVATASCWHHRATADEPGFAPEWKRNAFATSVFEINGTESRNNPIRRKLNQEFRGDELYIRYRIHYTADSVDTPEQDEGEFLVLWLDEAEGNDASTHSANVPNVGIHVKGNQNHFMVRYASRQERYGPPLIGGKDFLVVARLWKSEPGPDQPFDQLNLWVDPAPDAEFQPAASVENAKAISQVNWIGFSTGGKTEIDDRIYVKDIEVATSWRSILNLFDDPATAPAAQMAPAKRTIDFAKHVLPILESSCFTCHAGADAEIRLDVHDEVLNVCTPRNAEDSHLIQLVTSGEMPPDDGPKLSDKEIATLRTWIDEGVDWNEDRLPTPTPVTNHWAFQPIVRPEIPAVKNEAWIQTPVDAFIAAKQEELNISPAPPADKATLARRMSLDMLGLPPDGTNPTVDDLLSNSAHGERWGRHWLDVARWAESNGHQHNRFRPYAWRYRDWVVKAFNDDLPFDQFLSQQIAGDELAAEDETSDSEIVATGFLSAARYSGNELDKRIQRNDILVDIVNTTTSAFLGLTFECAQCHTHKFDPISLRDYYRMQAFFAKGQPSNVALRSNADSAKMATERWEIFDRTYDRLVSVRRRRGISGAELVIPKTVIARMKPEEKSRFQTLDKALSQVPQTWAYCSHQSPYAAALTPHEMRWPLPRDLNDVAKNPTFMLLRGDVNAPGPEVDPGWPLVFGESPDISERPRAALAKWMTSPENPLTARVWVNRVWNWHFGRGLVETVGDFGEQGTPPTHPKLLDFLASELIQNNWSTHHLHRLILNSATYQQSHAHSASNAEIDPDNKTYWRWTPRRLEAEAIRDCMLAASGQLNATAGGPSDEPNGKSLRRSIYLKQHRDRLPEQQQLFDSANGVVSCACRRVSTTGLQPLWLMNSDFSQSAAEALAKQSGTIAQAIRLCLQRDGTPDEVASLEAHAAKHGLPSACLVILNMNEFLYMP